jgi:hypothetical protein
MRRTVLMFAKDRKAKNGYCILLLKKEIDKRITYNQ